MVVLCVCGCWSAGEPVPDQIGGDDVRAYEKEPDELRTENGVPEDVEHVVSVVGQSERMDDGVVLNDAV